MSRTRALSAAFWALALALGALSAWSGRYEITPDGVSYLDMADAYLRGDWSMALNGWWNPLYTWLLCLAKATLHPNAYQELPLVHLVNFLVYAAGLGCAHFLLSQLALRRRSLDRSPQGRGTVSLPDWALFALGYTLYIWSSLDLVRLRVGEDLCLAAFAYLAFGLLIRIASRPGDWKAGAGLGAALGCGYLTKAVMLPLSAVFLLAVARAAGGWRRSLKPGLAAVLVLAALSGPFIILLSESKGRPTFGDTGKGTYAIYVSMDSQDRWTPPYFHWRGQIPGSGRPKHPTRKIFSSPDVYEFGTPFAASYGAWYDPSYWYEGLAASFTLRNQLRALAHNAEETFRLCLVLQPALLASLVILCWAGWKPRLDFLLAWLLMAPALAAIVLYSLVHLEPRFVGGFITVFWLAAFAMVRLPESPASRRLASGAVAGVVSAVLICTVLPDAWKDWRHGGSGRLDIRMARGLEALGIGPGAEVGSIGNGFKASVWARLARARIVAEITEQDAPSFWSADAATQSRVMAAFAAAGARAVVSDSFPRSSSASGWHRIPGLGPEGESYRIFDLRATAPENARGAQAGVVLSTALAPLHPQYNRSPRIVKTQDLLGPAHAGKASQASAAAGARA